MKIVKKKKKRAAASNLSDETGRLYIRSGCAWPFLIMWVDHTRCGHNRAAKHVFPKEYFLARVLAVPLLEMIARRVYVQKRTWCIKESPWILDTDIIRTIHTAKAVWHRKEHLTVRPQLWLQKPCLSTRLYTERDEMNTPFNFSSSWREPTQHFRLFH